MLRITDVVKQLLIINVLMFFGTELLMPNTSNALALYYPAHDLFRPWQLVTHLFMHGDLNHLFFNMFGLYIFGTMLEMHMGAKRFLTFYLLTGLGAMVLHLLVLGWELSARDPMYYQAAMQAVHFNMRGASGAIFGLLAGYAMLFPNHQLHLIIPPVAIKAKYLALGYAALELFLGVSNYQTGVAHYAHLGGAIFGAIIIYYWRKSGRL